MEKLDGKGQHVGIVVSRFSNSLITERQLKGAMDRLTRANVEGNAFEQASNKCPQATECLADMVNDLREIA